MAADSAVRFFSVPPYFSILEWRMASCITNFLNQKGSALCEKLCELCLQIKEYENKSKKRN
jgi:hypothetical protein